MPSSMIHSLAAYKYNKNSSTLFKIGNLAPDSISDWKFKDKMHLRNSKCREADLKLLANEVDLQDEFLMGVIFHLYLDLLWDSGPQQSFKDSFEGDNWFVVYREAIGTASAWLYHEHFWSEKYWNEICGFDFNKQELNLDYSNSDIRDMITRNKKWHCNNKPDSIGYFSQDVIDGITTFASNSFDDWLSGKELNFEVQDYFV